MADDYYIEKFRAYEPDFAVRSYLVLLKIERRDHWLNMFRFFDLLAGLHASTQLILLLLDNGYAGTMKINEAGTILAPQIYMQSEVRIERKQAKKLQLFTRGMLQGEFRAIWTREGRKMPEIETFIENFAQGDKT